MMRFTLILLFAVFLNGFSQDFRMGKVSKEELSQARHPLDTSAVAAVLSNKAQTTFTYTKRDGFSAIHKFSIRIKIYKKEGFEWGNYEIPYYIGFKELRPEMLEIKEAATYNLADGKVVRTKVDSDGKLTEKINAWWKTRTIVFPAVKEGSIVELEYELKSQNIHHFPKFIFQRNIPVNTVEYTTRIPSNYVYKPVITGDYDKVSVDSKLQYSGLSYENEHGKTESLNFQELRCIYTAKDLPALLPEPYLDNLENYRIALDQELEIIRFPGVEDKNFSQTWEGLATSIWKDEDFGKQFSDIRFLEPEVRKVVAGITDPEKRMDAIFRWVQLNMAWNGKFGFYAESGISKAFTSGKGNIADVNLLLRAMLKLAGIDARPVLCSTVSNGIAAFPSQTAFNYVVVSATLDDRTILLDASDKYSSPGILPSRILNWDGREVSSSGSSRSISLTPEKTSVKKMIVMADLTSDGKLSGKIRMIRNLHHARDFRENHYRQDKDQYLQSFEKDLNGIVVSDYAIENETRLEEAITQNFSFSGNYQGEISGDHIYLDPDVIADAFENPFRDEKRRYPVYFGFPSEYVSQIILTVPKGYSVLSVPENLSLTTDGNVCNYKFTTQGSPDNKHITIQQSFRTNSMLVSSNFYATLNEFFKKMKSKQNERIVLKKT